MNGPMMAVAAKVVAGRTLTEQVTAMLRDQILNGEIEPGARLLQDEVARRFKVSSTPVREAFSRLSAAGIVRSDTHRGVQVVSPTLADIAECYSIRQRLEPLAVEWAIANVPRSAFQPLEHLVAAMEQTTDPARFLELNHAFHSGLYGLSGSERLSSLIGVVREQAATYLLMLARKAGADLSAVMARADEEHREILEACRRGDAGEAAKAVHAHLVTGLHDIQMVLGK